MKSIFLITFALFFSHSVSAKEQCTYKADETTKKVLIESSIGLQFSCKLLKQSANFNTAKERLSMQGILIFNCEDTKLNLIIDANKKATFGTDSCVEGTVHLNICSFFPDMC